MVVQRILQVGALLGAQCPCLMFARASHCVKKPLHCNLNLGERRSLVRRIPAVGRAGSFVKTETGVNGDGNHACPLQMRKSCALRCLAWKEACRVESLYQECASRLLNCGRLYLLLLARIRNRSNVDLRTT